MSRDDRIRRTSPFCSRAELPAYCDLKSAEFNAKHQPTNWAWIYNTLPELNIWDKIKIQVETEDARREAQNESIRQWCRQHPEACVRCFLHWRDQQRDAEEGEYSPCRKIKKRIPDGPMPEIPELRESLEKCLSGDIMSFYQNGKLFLRLQANLPFGLYFNEDGKIRGAWGGIKPFLRNNAPDLLPHYEAIKHHKQFAEKVDQVAAKLNCSVDTILHSPQACSMRTLIQYLRCELDIPIEPPHHVPYKYRHTKLYNPTRKTQHRGQHYDRISAVVVLEFQKSTLKRRQI